MRALLMPIGLAVYYTNSRGGILSRMATGGRLADAQDSSVVRGRHRPLHRIQRAGLHNSFTHTIGELGLFGAFFFVGMRPHAVESHAWGEDLWQSGVALAVCAMFLSRQYNMLPFVWLALSSVYARQMALRPAVQPARAASHAARIAALTVAGAVCTYAVVRLFGDWSA